MFQHFLSLFNSYLLYRTFNTFLSVGMRVRLDSNRRQTQEIKSTQKVLWELTDAQYGVNLRRCYGKCECEKDGAMETFV